MFYLLLAIASSAMVSIIMRLSEKRVHGNVGMLAVNYLMCLVLAGSYMGFGNVMPDATGTGFAIGLGLVNGVLYLLGFVLLQVSVKRNGVVLSATFMKLGLLVPMVVSILFFGEMPKILQITGFVLAVAAIILINFEKEQSTMGFKIGLILLLLAGGGGDAMSKIFEELGNNELSEQFLFYTFAAALILCTMLVLYKKEKLDKFTIVYGLLIGIPNYFSARFLLLALNKLPAVLVYPTYSVATLMVITLAGVCFFKERLGKRQWSAIGIILIALVMLNI